MKYLSFPWGRSKPKAQYSFFFFFLLKFQQLVVLQDVYQAPGTPWRISMWEPLDHLWYHCWRATSCDYRNGFPIFSWKLVRSLIRPMRWVQPGVWGLERRTKDPLGKWDISMNNLLASSKNDPWLPLSTLPDPLGHLGKVPTGSTGTSQDKLVKGSRTLRLANGCLGPL